MKFLVSYHGVTGKEPALCVEAPLVAKEPLGPQVDAMLALLQAQGATFAEPANSEHYSVVPHGWSRPLPGHEVQALLDDLERAGTRPRPRPRCHSPATAMLRSSATPPRNLAPRRSANRHCRIDRRTVVVGIVVAAASTATAALQASRP